jgi:hypothetical protein
LFWIEICLLWMQCFFPIYHPRTDTMPYPSLWYPIISDGKTLHRKWSAPIDPCSCNSLIFLFPISQKLVW